MNIQEFREKYPEYSDRNDVEIVNALHKKYYSNLPFEAVANELGVEFERSELPLPDERTASLDPAVKAEPPMLDFTQFSGSITQNPPTAFDIQTVSDRIQQKFDSPSHRLKEFEPESDEVGRVESAFGELAGGAGDIFSGTARGLGIQESKRANNTLQILDAIDRGETTGSHVDIMNKFGFTANDYNSHDVTSYLEGKPPPIHRVLDFISGESMKMTYPNTPDKYRASVRDKNAKATNPFEQEFYKAGQQIDEYIAEKFETNPEFREEFLAGKLPRGLGSALSFMTTAMITRGMGSTASAVTVAGLGSQTNASGQFLDALNEGANLEEAFEAADMGALVGTSEAVPIMTLLNRLDKSSGGVIKQALKNALKSGTEEAIQETFQTVMNNLSAQAIYDYERGTWEGSGENAGVGFSTGSILGFLTTIIGGRRSKDVSRETTDGVEQVEGQTGTEVAETAPTPAVTEQTDRRQDEERVETDRRENETLRERINKGDATNEEIITELYTDKLTGVGNRRAYEESGNTSHEAVIDGDSLKWFNDNIGHEFGDNMLTEIANTLSETVEGTVYRTGGDEFVVKSNDPAATEAQLKAAQQQLEQSIITVENPDGSRVTVSGLGISYGVGENFNNADQKLNESKAQREAEGKRAKRAEQPKGVEFEQAATDTQAGSAVGQDQAGSQDSQSASAEVTGEKTGTMGMDMPGSNVDNQVDNKPDVMAHKVDNAAAGAQHVPVIGKSGELPIIGENEFQMTDGRVVKVPEKPIRRRDIVKKLQKAFGVKVYSGRVKGKSRLGFFRRNVGEIRTKSKDDLEVTAHEVSHWLDDRNPWVEKLYKNKKFDKEIRGVSYDADKLHEGFAEFMRLFFTNEVAAIESAPQFYEAFTEKIEGTSLEKPLKDVQADMHAWYRQGALKRFESKIGESDVPLTARVTDAVDGAYDKIVSKVLDGLQGFKAAEAALVGDLQDATLSGYKSLRLAAGARGVVKAIFERGTIGWSKDGDIEFTGKGLRDVLAPVSDKLDSALKYFVARRAQELSEQGRENLFRPDEIAAGLKLGKDNPEIETAFNEWLAFNKRMMDFYEQSGLINRETRKAVEEMNQNYVPFHRVIESAETGKKATKGGSPFMRLKGGTANIDDVFENMMASVNTLTSMALTNKAKQNFYNMIDSTEDSAFFAAKIGKDSKPVTVNTEELKATFLRGLGIDPKMYNAAKKTGVMDKSMLAVDELMEMMDSNLGDFALFFKHGIDPKGPRLDYVLRNGKKQWYEVADQLLWDSIVHMGETNTNLGLQILGGFKNVLTRSITSLPDFQVPNFIRDTFNAFTMSRGGMVPVVDSAKGFFDKLKKDDDYWLYMANGGGFASTVHGETQAARRKLEKLYLKHGISMDKVLDKPRKLLDAWDEITSAFEYGTRLAEFKAMKAKGESSREAALGGREVSTDFAMRGKSELVKWFTTSVPFLNARLQGLYKLKREVSEKGGKPALIGTHAFSFALRGVTALMLPTLALYMYNKDDERYQEMEEWIKDLHWVIFYGSDEDDYFLIPKPFETGAIFATIPERTMELAEKRDGKEFADAMLWVAMEAFAMDLMPQAVQPVYDLKTNKKWTGAPIIPHYLQGVESAEQYNEYTSDSMVALGRKLGISPIQAEHMVRGYFGTLGNWMLMLSDGMVEDVNSGGTEPAKAIGDYPVFRRFIHSGPPKRTKHETDFYDLAKEAGTVVNTFRRIESIDPERLGEYITSDKRAELFSISGAVDDIKSVARELSRQASMIKRSSDMTAVEKREALNNLQREKNRLFKEAAKQLDKKALDEIEAML